jgi:hypothetical protein
MLLALWPDQSCVVIKNGLLTKKHSTAPPMLCYVFTEVTQKCLTLNIIALAKMVRVVNMA